MTDVRAVRPVSPAGAAAGGPPCATAPPSWVRSAGRRDPLGGPRTAVALAVAAGSALLLAFPGVGWWPLAPVGVGLLALACRGRTARAGAGLGLLAGLVLFVPLLAWVRLVGDDAWLALAASQAVFFAGLGAALSRVSRLPGWPVWGAALWVAAELARSRVPFGGMPWGRLGFSQAGSPFAPYAALAGVPLVGFAVALSGGLLAAAVVAGPRVRTGGALLAAVGVAAVGLLVPLPTAGEGGAGAPGATVAVVQGNVPRLGLDALAQRRAVLDNHANQTLRLAAAVRSGRLPRPQLVIWPENSSDLDPYLDPSAAAQIDQAARAVGVPILVGAIVEAGPRFVANTGIVWDPRTGPGQRYVKRHPVPFAEYVPFRSVLTRYIARFSLVPRDFVGGRRAGVLTLGPARIGDVICFEVAYDNLVRAAVRSGGRLLVVQTNNASFGRSAETQQQLAMSRLRAVEHGRAVLVAATSGVSAVIAPNGRVLARSRVFHPALLVARVPLRSRATLADRLGVAPEWCIAGLGLLGLLAGSARRRRRRP